MTIAKQKSFRAIVNPKTKVLRILCRDKLNDFLETLTGEVDITISEVSSRTHFQNNYYWKVVIGTLIKTDPLIGHSKNEMHEVLKQHFNIESTSKLDKYEFMEYIDEIIRWAAMEWEIVIPEPNEEEVG